MYRINMLSQVIGHSELLVAVRTVDRLQLGVDDFLVSLQTASISQNSTTLAALAIASILLYKLLRYTLY